MKPIPWTHSHLDRFKNCPHQFAEVKVYKRYADAAMDGGWGNWVHDQISEHWLLDPPIAWHANMVPYAPHVERVVAWAREIGSSEEYFERKLAINTRLQPCDFFAKDVWSRGVVDLLTINREARRARAVDWKTGKVKPDNVQLERFVLLILAGHPEIDTVETSFEWLQFPQEQPTRAVWTREQTHDLWRKQLPILLNYKQAFDNEVWTKRPSGLCRGWCPVETCEHWQPKK